MKSIFIVYEDDLPAEDALLAALEIQKTTSPDGRKNKYMAFTDNISVTREAAGTHIEITVGYAETPKGVPGSKPV